MYLASFAEFIFSGDDVNDYFKRLKLEAIQSFIECRILCFEEASKVPIHFIGSIAYFCEDSIKECLKIHQLEMGTIIRRPIDGLITYYQTHKLNN